MYAIKMNEDKSLNTTVQSTIYQYEKNADTMVFLLPKYYDDKTLSDCSVLLRYILPDGTGKSEELEMSPIPYNKEYNQYSLKVNTRFTETPGKIELWLCAIDIRDSLVLKTGTAHVEITPAKDITDFMSPDDLNQLDRLALRVRLVEEEKADDIAVNEEGDTIQLMSKGRLIGHAIELDTNPEWLDMDEVIITPGVGSVSAMLASLDDGSTARIANGDVDEPLTIRNSITVKGADAGCRQNYKQEVGI